MGVVMTPGAAVNLTPNARAPLAAWAVQACDGGHFERGGRGPIAFDCMGLVTWAQAQIGRRVRDYLDLYRELDIKRRGDVNQLMRAEAEAWRNVDAGGVGDVLVLGSGDRAHHVAVLCGGGYAAHATSSRGLLCEKIEGRARVSRFSGMRIFACVSPA